MAVKGETRWHCEKFLRKSERTRNPKSTSHKNQWITVKETEWEQSVHRNFKDGIVNCGHSTADEIEKHFENPLWETNHRTVKRQNHFEIKERRTRGTSGPSHRQIQGLGGFHF